MVKRRGGVRKRAAQQGHRRLGWGGYGMRNAGDDVRVLAYPWGSMAPLPAVVGSRHVEAGEPVSPLADRGSHNLCGCVEGADAPPKRSVVPPGSSWGGGADMPRWGLWPGMAKEPSSFRCWSLR